MSFYHFRQNNSGGSFDYDPTDGISVHVIVEAGSVTEANDRARGLGIYFNGCSTGRDCGCCGDRWSEAYSSSDATAEPTAYSVIVKEDEPYPARDEPNGDMGKSMDEGKAEGFIHYLKGPFVGFWQTTNPRKDLQGQFGYGVQFSRENASWVFLVGKNGWDESGNYEAPGHGDDYLRNWKRPKGPLVEITRNGSHNYGWGKAWFPSEVEAKRFAEAMNLANKSVQRQIQAAKTAAVKEIMKAMKQEKGWEEMGPLLTEGMKVWNKT